MRSGVLRDPLGRAATLVIAALLVYMPDVGTAGTAFLLIAVLACFHAEYVDKGTQALGLTRLKARDLVVGIVAALGMWVLAKIAITPFAQWWTDTPRNLTRFDPVRGNAVALLTRLLAIWITAAFAEEVLFRGFLWEQISRMAADRPIARAGFVVVSAALFGAVHADQSAVAVIQTGILGLFFATLFIANGRRLWANVVAHGVFDTTTLLLIFTSLDQPLNRWLYSLR